MTSLDNYLNATEHALHATFKPRWRHNPENFLIAFRHETRLLLEDATADAWAAADRLTGELHHAHQQLAEQAKTIDMYRRTPPTRKVQWSEAAREPAPIPGATP